MGGGNPAFIPRFGGWEPSPVPFCWRTVLQREYNAFFLIIVVFFLLDLIGDSIAERRFKIDATWFGIFIGGFVCFCHLAHPQEAHASVDGGRKIGRTEIAFLLTCRLRLRSLTLLRLFDRNGHQSASRKETIEGPQKDAALLLCAVPSAVTRAVPPAVPRHDGQSRGSQFQSEVGSRPACFGAGALMSRAMRKRMPRYRERERSGYDGDTAIKLYLREIGQVKLLTPAGGNPIGGPHQKGRQKGPRADDQGQLALVVKIAHDYENFGLPLLDLINEGNIGLMKAVERFDPAKGGKLSTYGSWWIKQSIKRALANQSKTIRLPVHLVDKISKMRRTAMKLQEVFGREPTDEELAEEMGWPPSRVAQMRLAAIRPASLDAPIGDDDSNNFAEVVQDENADTPYQHLEEKTVTRMLREMVKTLDPREATILQYRFGLDGGTEKTLEEVGEKFGVTRERVRQIQNIALHKLRRMIEKLEAVKS